MGDSLSKDGAGTQALEKVPIGGYVDTAHAIQGDEERAKRTAAKCTNTSVTTIVGTGGAVCGLGRAGIIGGAAAGTAIEGAIARDHIHH